MKIITDSTVDLPWDLIKAYDIQIVPLTIKLGDRQWKDFFDIDPETYYKMLRDTTEFPTTSQPSPQDFVNAYAPYVEAGEPILSVHLSSRLSGTYQSARLASQQFPGAKIEVIDSLLASMAMGMVIVLCARKAMLGIPFEDIVDLCKKLSKNVDTYFSVDSLDYLHRGGRIGKAGALLGTLMKIKPLLKLVEGEVRPAEKIRTTERLLSRYAEIIEKEAQEHRNLSLSVAESDNSEIMTGLLERITKIPGVSFVYRGKIGGVITSHVGPGLLGVALLKGYSE